MGLLGSAPAHVGLPGPGAEIRILWKKPLPAPVGTGPPPFHPLLSKNITSYLPSCHSLRHAPPLHCQAQIWRSHPMSLSWTKPPCQSSRLSSRLKRAHFATLRESTRMVRTAQEGIRIALQISHFSVWF